MIWAEVKEIWSQGPGEYLLEPWNFLDFGMLAIFLASFSCRFSALRHAASAQTFVHLRYTTLSNITLPPEIYYFTLGEAARTDALVGDASMWFLFGFHSGSTCVLAAIGPPAGVGGLVCRRRGSQLLSHRLHPPSQ